VQLEHALLYEVQLIGATVVVVAAGQLDEVQTQFALLDVVHPVGAADDDEPVELPIIHMLLTVQ